MTDNFEQFTTIDDSQIEQIVNQNIENGINETLYPGDERKIFSNALISLLCTVFAYLNERAKQRLLRFAKAETLDYLGERVNCTRLQANHATTLMRYKLQEALNTAVTIPQGSRVTPDGVLYWETTEVATIPIGSTYIDVAAISTEGGLIYNDYPKGAINTQVDIVPYISSVENITITKGGDDGEPYPLSDEHPEGDDGTGDDNYRERIRKAPAGFSTAGPSEAYEYFALSADATIEDVKITSEQEAGRVDITATTNGGNVPTAEILEKILNKCSDKSVRPMNDRVFVYGPEQIDYDINIHYYVTEDAEADAVDAIEKTGGAIDKYIEWQRAKISRDINPDKLKALLVAAGAKRATITAPVYKDLGITQSVTSYSVKDADNTIKYVATSGTKDTKVAAGVDVYDNPRLIGVHTTTIKDSTYTYTGDEVVSPKGIGELAHFSGNLTVTHEVEGE